MVVWGKRADTTVHGDEPFNAEPARAALAENPLTPTEVFYSRNHGPIPDIDPTGWRLTVDGRVDRPLTLSLEDLQQRFPRREIVATLQCAGNRRLGLIDVDDIPGETPWGPGATSTAQWTGVALADVLAAARSAADARYVAFTALDVSPDAAPEQPFGASIPMHKATATEVLLAWQMNDAPLPRIHGAPLRLVVPGYIGARSVKWLNRITVQDTPSDSYFQTTAYRLLPADADPTKPHPHGIPLGTVALNADVLVPDDGATVTAGLTTVRGYAFAGHERGVARVDVSIDAGNRWTQADLDPAPGPWAWQFWHAQVDLPPGDTRIAVRAWDTTGACMPEDPAQLWNPKGYANNAWARITVHAR